MLLFWSVVFLVVALVSAVFGYGGFAAHPSGFARVMFYTFLCFAVLSFGVNLFRPQKTLP